MIKIPQAHKATANKKRALFIILCAFLHLSLIGCGKNNAETLSSEEQTFPIESAFVKPEEIENLVSLYHEIYEEAMRTKTSENIDAESLTIVQEITRKLGERGITAIDSENQVDMVNPDRMNDFITSLKSGESADLTVLIVSAYNRFTEYDLHAKEGILEAVKTYYQYENGSFEAKSAVSFPSDSWQYTDEGYFIFTGKSFSAQSLVLTMSDEEEFTAWRVDPLDAQCRKWNRQYVLPIGYGKNNMFLTDWNENDYGTLDFYDIFDKFYSTVNNYPIPYTASENVATGAVYQIPEDEFENVISLHFAIDRDVLHTKTSYLETVGAYEYRPRGFYEVEYPNLPYPEVISGTENNDGTLTLLVNAVYPNAETSKAFTHELVIRPDTQGGFQYVSNRMLHTERDSDMGWHTDRLTAEEWENVYGNSIEQKESEIPTLTQ